MNFGGDSLTEIFFFNFVLLILVWLNILARVFMFLHKPSF